MQRFTLDPRELAREESIDFEGPVGSIEALWRPARADRPPRAVVVVAHPHPAFGGTMHNKVVFHTARVLNHDLDAASLRFNFRGVGESEGAYDEGRGEVDDLLAAWAEARRRGPDLPLIAAGFSFGAGMTLHAATRVQAKPVGLALLGIPLRIIEPPDPYPVPVPIAAVHGDQDQYTPPEKVREYLDRWPAAHAFHEVPDTDHFFEGRLPEATQFLSEQASTWL